MFVIIHYSTLSSFFFYFLRQDMINVRGGSLLYTCISFFWFHGDVMINIGGDS